MPLPVVVPRARSSRRRLAMLSLPVLGLGAILALAASRGIGSAGGDLATLARQATSTDSSAAHRAITALRGRGPAGLEALFFTYSPEIAKHNPDDARWQRIALALDSVARQKDADASHLYWYTDLAAAERAAQASGKPILSLRMLGNLDEELSCANSRFFRTALYPNAEVADYLRSHYILHWRSVRPVPVFTLDFGDGRKITRTLTGNSIHYVLDSRGRVVDALPGLYGPQAFVQRLTAAEEVARTSAEMTVDAARADYLQKWHQDQFDTLAADWKTDTGRAYGPGAVGVPTLTALIATVGRPRGNGATPTALQAAPLAVSKSAGELPLVQALSAGAGWSLGAPSLEWAWDQIGQLHTDDVALDASARAAILAKNPDLSRVSDESVVAPQIRFGLAVRQQAVNFSNAKSSALPPADRLIANFTRAMAQDSVRNEYVYHAKLHQWFAAGEVTGDVEALNKRVYSDLFLTPDSDPWLGLAPGGAYVALPHDGLTGNVRTNAEQADSDRAVAANAGR